MDAFWRENGSVSKQTEALLTKEVWQSMTSPCCLCLMQPFHKKKLLSVYINRRRNSEGRRRTFFPPQHLIRPLLLVDVSCKELVGHPSKKRGPIASVAYICIKWHSFYTTHKFCVSGWMHFYWLRLLYLYCCGGHSKLLNLNHSLILFGQFGG